jgi:hypothetical protein
MRFPKPSRPAPVILIGGVALMLVGIGACQDAGEGPELGAELDEIAAENRMIEDLNRLQLSAGQVQALIVAVKELRGAAAPIEQERQGVLAELKPLLLKQRSFLIGDENPPATLRDQVAQAEGKLRELEERMAAALNALAPRLREALAEPQIAILSGAESARRQVADLLEGIREMDAATYQREVGPTAEEFADPQAGITAGDIRAVFDAARKMSAAEYRDKGAELQQKLMPLYMPTEAAGDQMLVDFFMQRGMPKVLSDKLEAMQETG